MIVDTFFEIGLLILGLLYVGDMYLDSVIRMIEIANEMDEKAKEESNDKELEELSKHMYS